jgi:hypothetical protein
MPALAYSKKHVEDFYKMARKLESMVSSKNMISGHIVMIECKT